MTVKQTHSIMGHVKIFQIIETAKKCRWNIKDMNEAFTEEGF
jgi:hypothetical protein